MADSSFTIKNYGVFKVRLDPTDITGIGNAITPVLRLPLKLQLLPVPGPEASDYTLIRMFGTIAIASQQIARFEVPPIAERSNPTAYERQVEALVSMNLRQVAAIETLRAGKDPSFEIRIDALVVLNVKQEFERLSGLSLHVSVPRSHWLDKVIQPWNISRIKVLEVQFPQNSCREFVVASDRLERAEHCFRIGDYPQVLTLLRSAFESLADAYGNGRADKNFFDKMLHRSHPSSREKLRDSFDYFYRMLNLGPHEPTPTVEGTAISRHDARFAIIGTHAIFEYLSAESWPETSKATTTS